MEVNTVVVRLPGGNWVLFSLFSSISKPKPAARYRRFVGVGRGENTLTTGRCSGNGVNLLVGANGSLEFWICTRQKLDSLSLCRFDDGMQGLCTSRGWIPLLVSELRSIKVLLPSRQAVATHVSVWSVLDQSETGGTYKSSCASRVVGRWQVDFSDVPRLWSCLWVVLAPTLEKLGQATYRDDFNPPFPHHIRQPT